MPSPRFSTRSIRPALDAAGFVGTWDWSVTTGQVVLDAGSAAAVAGNPALAGQVIDLDTALTRLHAEDRGWVEAKIQVMAETCGTILAEYRVQAPDGSVRWLLDRGRVSKQPDGTLHGRGIWLDVTEIRQGATRGDDPAEDPLTTVADHIIQARELLPSRSGSLLRLMLDMALLELGRHIARSGQEACLRPH